MDRTDVFNGQISMMCHLGVPESDLMLLYFLRGYDEQHLTSQQVQLGSDKSGVLSIIEKYEFEGYADPREVIPIFRERHPARETKKEIANTGGAGETAQPKISRLRAV